MRSLRLSLAALTVVGLLLSGSLVTRADEAAPAVAAPPAARAVPAAVALDAADPSPSTSGGTAASRYWDAPAKHHWAVIIGINDYAGGTEDNVGSRQDAKKLYNMMRNKGWRADHIRLLLDRRATASNIVKAVKWLGRKTTDKSVVVFHYAGHEMPFYSDRDGDSERRDVALWAADNRFVIDGHLGKLMGKVRARKMWIHFATCRAGGFSDRGMIKKGRVITYSSPESELSYEDPSVGHSVLGYYMVHQGMKKKWADRNGNGKVSVEEAFRYADHRVVRRTGDRQHPFIKDKLKGSFLLRVPKPRPQQSQPGPEPEPEPAPCWLICP